MSSRIVEMLKTISSGGTISEIPQSRLEAIAVAISKNASYDDAAQSRIEELLLDLYNNGAGSGTDALPYSEVEAILIAAINGDTYTGTVSSEISQAFVDSVDAIGGGTPEPGPGPGPGPEPPEPIPEMTYTCQKLMSMVLTEFVDPSNIRSLGDYVMAYDTVIENATFQKVTQIPTSCFEQSTNLKFASFPNATRNSGNRCFMGCENLETIYLPACTSALNSVLTSSCCPKLKYLDIKTSSFNFDLSTNGAVSLEKLVLRGTSAVSGTPSFHADSPIAKLTGAIYVQDNLVSSYKNSDKWSAYASIIHGLSDLEE